MKPFTRLRFWLNHRHENVLKHILQDLLNLFDSWGNFEIEICPLGGPSEIL